MWSCLTLGCAFAQTVHVVVWCAVQGPYRSRSAPREEAAARRHIERMNASPNRTTAAAVAASRDSILAGQQQQALPSWQREQAVRQSGGNLRGSAGFSSPSAKKVCVCVLALLARVAGPGFSWKTANECQMVQALVVACPHPMTGLHVADTLLPTCSACLTCRAVRSLLHGPLTRSGPCA